MLNVNPEKASSVQSWNSDSKDDRLGFIFRDSSTTNAQSTPMVIPRLGYDASTFMARRDDLTGADYLSGRGLYWMDGSRLAGSYKLASVAGILTYDYIPMFAQSYVTTPGFSDYGEVPDIFINVWSRLRRLNNMTEKFMPSDVQWVYNGYMEILAHTENIRRILKVMQRIVRSPKSNYIQEETLLSALGFPMSQVAARQNWVNWRNLFNVSILGKLRAISWFTDLVPGAKRWAGLCKEIYKDDPNRTDYTQLYVIRPRYVWHVQEGLITSTPADLYGWKAVKTDYMCGDGSVGNNGASAFQAYMELIIQMINDVFYSDSASIVLATINAIDARNWKEDQKMTFQPIDLEDLPFDLGDGDYPFTYDFNVMLSIHNATILDENDPYFSVEAPQMQWQYDSTLGRWNTDGALYQRVWLYKNITKEGDTEGETTHKVSKAEREFIDTYRTNAYGVKATSSAGYNLAITSFAKSLNLPWYNASMEDFINATQWTIVSNGFTIATNQIPLEPDAVGTEILVRERIYRFLYAADGTPQLDSFDITNLHYINLADSNLGYATGVIGMLNSFALYPIIYQTNTFQSIGEKVVGMYNQEDVLYAASRAVLQPIHAQFVRNFWGYPLIVGSSDPTNKTENSTRA